MIDGGTPSAAEPYSPQRRTAILFSGTGTAGVYHAGVLRALHEAGVKLDVVAGRGVGAISALFAAVDGGQRLWDEKGFWGDAAVRRFYGWRPAIRFVAAILLASVAATARMRTSDGSAGRMRKAKTWLSRPAPPLVATETASDRVALAPANTPCFQLTYWI